MAAGLNDRADRIEQLMLMPAEHGRETDARIDRLVEAQARTDARIEQLVSAIGEFTRWPPSAATSFQTSSMFIFSVLRLKRG